MKPQNATYTYAPGYTFPGNLPTELFNKPYIGTPALSEMFSIRQGIRTDEYLILVGQMEKVLKAYVGCNPTYTGAGTLSDRKITVGKFSVHQDWCVDDFTATASVLSNDPAWIANGMDAFDVSAKVRSLWMDNLIEAIRLDIWRIVTFGNDTSTNADYNVIDGLLVKLMDAFASYCVKAVGNNFPNQYNSLLGTDEAYNAFKALHVGSPIILKQLMPSEKVFWVTGSVYENLLASYESKTAGTSELQFKMITDGVSQLTYRGIEVRPLYIWDNYLEDSNNPWYNNLRHLIIYTPKGGSKFSNLVIGTERASDLDRIDMLYNTFTKTTIADAVMRFGVQFINCDLTAIHH